MLVNGSVLDAICCGADANVDTFRFSLSTMDNTAKVIVVIARSILINYNRQNCIKKIYQFHNLYKNMI